MEELLYSLIQLAIEHKASDIHFIVKQDHMDIQFRNDLGWKRSNKIFGIRVCLNI